LGIDFAIRARQRIYWQRAFIVLIAPQPDATSKKRERRVSLLYQLLYKHHDNPHQQQRGNQRDKTSH
jgi:hypothetical protein